jgi:hypothetical protein
MAITYRFPTNESLNEVVRDYEIPSDMFKGEEILPFMDTETTFVEWDELDHELGMTAAHNPGTDPKQAARPGSKTHRYEPLHFKETDVIRENELLRARELGTLGGMVDLTTLVGRTLKARMDKNKIRAEWLRWQALFGGFAIDENGVKVSETFPVQTYDAAVDWDTVATARPLHDFNQVKLLFRGTGATIQGAKAYLNQTTANWLLENANANDLAGFRAENFRNTPSDLGEMNKLLGARGLPMLEVYDEGYYKLDGDFELFIPDGKIAIPGRRPAGQKVGDFCLTPTPHRLNRAGQAAPGMFAFIEVNGQSNRGSAAVSMADLGAGKNPRIELTGGFYGGPRMQFAKSVVVMTVKQ